MYSRKECFIIAPFNVNLKKIKSHLLNKYNIKSYDTSDIEIFTNVINELKNKIYDCDFVIIILFGDNLSNIYFELGLTIGIDKPIFLITDNFLKIPDILSDITYVNTDNLDIEKIDFVFSVFYKKSIKERKKSHAYKKIPENIEIPGSLIKAIKGYEFEEKIIKILELDSTLTVIKQPETEFFDLVIWSDIFINYFSNPIFVEIKRNPNKHTLIKTSERMRKYLTKRNLNLGIIIYEGRKLDFEEKSMLPFIFVFHINDIENQLDEKKPFSRLIVDKRNKILHGGL